MKIVKWAAVGVTALFVLMNLGAAVDAPTMWVRIVGAVLGVAGIAAAFGLATNQPWGATAVVGVGVLNVVGSLAALTAHEDGWAIGLVVGALGALLGLLAGRPDRAPVSPAH